MAASEGGVGMDREPRIMSARSLRELLPAEALMAIGRGLNWNPRDAEVERRAREWAWREPEPMADGALARGLWGEARGMGQAAPGPSLLKKMEPSAPLWSLSGPGGRVEQEGLPVFWSLTQSRFADEEDDRDVACLILTAALRHEPEAGPPRGMALFAAFSFEGRADGLWGARLEGPGRCKCGVVSSLAQAGEVEQGLLGAGRLECARFVMRNPLWRALPEWLNPGFYERRELARAAAPGSGRARAPGL